MTFVRWWTAALALMGFSIALCLGVVCLMYFSYMDIEPRLRYDWPKLLLATEMFLFVGVVAGAAFWSLHRRNRWLWPMQAILALTVLVLGQKFWSILAT